MKQMEEKLDDIEVFNIVLPVGKDPDECSQEEFKNYMDKSKHFFDFHFSL